MSKFSKTKKLSRTIGHRKALMRNMMSSLVMCEQIKSTSAKIHVLRPYADKTLSAAMKNDLNAKKYVFKLVNEKAARKKIFDVLVPRYAGRKSGFTRIYKIGRRLSDSSEMSLIKLV